MQEQHEQLLAISSITNQNLKTFAILRECDEWDQYN